ncbi:PTPLA-domain-containing protein [Pleurotus eryngii]|uniref:Very-long-chain (3R)-3-hydroxyacyl-CoA dehydratase n=1 Tax=Pleurotus eryngii TaxID=5323 RepID=A0A9P6A876_PLEER|nr:PTPLA-domain-containing protein [Pleurotus eryngii]
MTGHAASKRKPRSAPPLVKYYLVAYNVLSTLGWAMVLIFTIIHVFDLDGASSSIPGSKPETATSVLHRFVSSFAPTKYAKYITNASLEAQLHPALVPLYRRSTTTYARVGSLTAFVQSFALLEVVHVLLGWVRSPLQTTAMQVASRLFLVWGIVEPFEASRSNPLYTSMVFAWSATETIRYPFYACSLLGLEPYPLLYLRYTTFYLLYPFGASSEAFIIYSTLPRSSPIPSLQSWMQGMWNLTDYIRGVLFCIWWPGLYVMYTYMIKQRRKVLESGGKTLGATPKQRKLE